MKRWLTLTLVAMLIVTLVGNWTQTAAQEADTTVKVVETPELGQFFTDGEGRTLYLWTVDVQPGVSFCFDACVDFWPLFTADEPLTLPDGVEGTLTLIERKDGTTQVAYNDIPLYYFAADKAPGDTNGQWAGDTWFVVAPGETFGTRAAQVLQDVSTPVSSTTVLIASDPTLGDYFTDAEGHTLYLFTKDTELFTSACTGDCLTNWPPVPGASGRLTLPSGASGELALMDGNDGSKQLAYNGIPLYYFAGDTEPGQLKGQGVGGVWWIVQPGAQLGRQRPQPIRSTLMRSWSSGPHQLSLDCSIRSTDAPRQKCAYVRRSSDQFMNQKNKTMPPTPAPTSAIALPISSKPSFQTTQPMPKPAAAPRRTQAIQAKMSFHPCIVQSPVARSDRPFETEPHGSAGPSTPCGRVVRDSRETVTGPNGPTQIVNPDTGEYYHSNVATLSPATRTLFQSNSTPVPTASVRVKMPFGAESGSSVRSCSK